MKLLRIDSSARNTSVSRRLTQSFVDTWKSQHPGGTVIDRDLAKTPVSHVTDEWVAAVHTDSAKLTDDQQRLLKTSNELISEIQSADVVVIGVPMYNFTVPSSLKAWIDQIVRMGVTFSYGASGPVGLIKGKKVFVLTSRGGAYQAGTPTHGFDFQEPYLRHILGFIGLTDVTFINAENQMRDSAGLDLAAATEKIQHAAA